jgi:hypothetical protein
MRLLAMSVCRPRWGLDGGSSPHETSHRRSRTTTPRCRPGARAASVGQVYTAERIERDPAWEPTRRGWRCGDCARARASEIKERAARLLAGAAEPWALVLSDAEHKAFDDCLDCDVLRAAQALLPARGGALRPDEARALAAAVLASGF